MEKILMKFTKVILELIYVFGNVAGYKINI